MLALVVGTALGIGAYTFVYAKGASYLTNDPAACVNCHIMREHMLDDQTFTERQQVVKQPGSSSSGPSSFATAPWTRWSPSSAI